MPDELDPEDRRSRARINELSDSLLAEASAVLRERPGLRLVAFVIEPDAPEGVLVRQLLPPNVGPPTGGFAGVVERALAIRILGVVAPALLDWLEAEDAGPNRGLLLVYLARTGMRTAVIEWSQVD